MIEALKRFNAAAAAVLISLAAVGFVIVAAIISWQVFGRYVLNASPSWSEQASLTLMIWYVSFAAAAGVREGFHIRITAFQTSVPLRFRKYLTVLSHLTVAVCGAAMVWFGSELVAGVWDQNIPSLGLPRGVAYMGMPIAGIFIVLFVIEALATDEATNNPNNEGAS